MYIVLSGAKANAGDFLITQRAVGLLRALRPEHPVVTRPAWEPLDPNDPEVGNADAILIAGGPGYRANMVPEVYPLATPLEALPPVVPLGVGFKGRSGDPLALGRYAFDGPTRSALASMARRGPGLGCRDRPTVTVLREAGFAAARLVGCPVWYDLQCLETPVQLPKRIRRLAFTPAQEHALSDQSIALMDGLARLFPRAERVCAFHRGLDRATAHVPEADLANTRRIAQAAERLGFGLADLTGGAAGLAIYNDCDLHVGYRVHGHLYFLSRRRPSLLLHEDGRGFGVSCTLDVQGIDAYAPLVSPEVLARYGKHLPGPIEAKLAQRQLASATAVATALDTLGQDVDTGFARFAGLSQVIDTHFALMRDFVGALPG